MRKHIYVQLEIEVLARCDYLAVAAAHCDWCMTTHMAENHPEPLPDTPRHTLKLLKIPTFLWEKSVVSSKQNNPRDWAAFNDEEIEHKTSRLILCMRKQRKQLEWKVRFG
jgi:hypothetical protein